MPISFEVPANLEAGFLLGPWHVEPTRNAIFQEKSEKHLENRLMQTLVFLAANPGQVITREQFFDSVWKGLVVNEEALSRAISLLRTALDDNAHAPKYVQTIPGVGYRLIAEVSTAPAQQVKAPRDKKTEQNSIAVLPFVNLSEDPDNEYFSEGISEEILNVLAQIEKFKVVGRTSSFAFKDRNEDLRDIGKTLGVTHVLEGSVRKAGNRVRITAQLIKTEDGYHLWSETFDRVLDDIFAVQDEIAKAVTVKLKLALLTTTPKFIETNPEAYELYLQSRYLERRCTSPSYKQALKLIQQALAIAPDYAVAWHGLASIYTNMTLKAELTPAEGWHPARDAAEQALAYHPDYAPTHALLGLIACNFEPDLAIAARHYQKAMELAPTDIEVIGSAAMLARTLGRLDTAIALQGYANTRDPLNPTNHSFQGYNLRAAGLFDEAISSYRMALRLSPDTISAHYNIGVSKLLQGKPEEALMETMKEATEGYRSMGLIPIYHDLGMVSECEATMAAWIEMYSAEGAYNIGFNYAYIGQNDLAFEWLEIARKNQDSGLSQIITEPMIAKLHSDSRWMPFLEHMGMSDEQLAVIKFDVTLPD